MPEDNESSVKARRISHIMRQVRKRATVSSADTSGKLGSAGAEQSGWQRQLLAIRQPLRANTELGTATVDQETIRKSQREALEALETLAKQQRSEEQNGRSGGARLGWLSWLQQMWGGQTRQRGHTDVA